MSYYTKTTTFLDSASDNSIDLLDDEFDNLQTGLTTTLSDVTNLETTVNTDRKYGFIDLPFDLVNYMTAAPTRYVQWLNTSLQQGANVSYFFSPSANNDAVWSVTLPFDAKATQNPYLVIQYAGESTAAGTADFSVWYNKFADGDVTENGSIASTKEDVVLTPVNTVLRTETVLLNNYTYSAGNYISIRLLRLATSDSYSGNLKIYTARLKYEKATSVT
jgi:hypothetical protein